MKSAVLLCKGRPQESAQISDTSLPENYRHVVVLREMRGEDTLTAARTLKITPANVKVRLHRAHAMLRREYQQVLVPPLMQAEQHVC